MEAIKVLREAFTNHLHGAVERNLQSYTSDKPWLAEMAAGSPWELETDLVPTQRIELIEPDGTDLKDIENACRMYEIFPHLSPLNARDPRLWTRLTHIELWSYMRRRWPVERQPDDDKGRAIRFIQAGISSGGTRAERSCATERRDCGGTRTSRMTRREMTHTNSRECYFQR
jgi:hypothetical protein